jgi:hypothetical protein
MLNRGRSVGTLGGLRQRLANLFLQFIETPDFNPEATRFLKVCRRHLKFFQAGFSYITSHMDVCRCLRLVVMGEGCFQRQCEWLPFASKANRKVSVAAMLHDKTATRAETKSIF